MSPYQGRPSRSFWRSGVAEAHPLSPKDLYRKKFEIRPSDRIATAGSCFAQHIARNMKAQGYSVVDAEPPPPNMNPDTAQGFGYGLYSARYANIYTARQLAQLAAEAVGDSSPHHAVWEKDGRFYDALRPSVEPTGLGSAEAVVQHRQYHLERVRFVLGNCDLFVFTLGLTEAWVHKDGGTVYPTAPGTIAGRFDPDVFQFKNFSFGEILEDMLRFRTLLKAHNPSAKMLLTVSPVPLTATATDDHVLVATTYSKSVLRAVAGQLASEHDDIDYFPSYEIIASHPSRGFFFESNLRSVSSEGVAVVMRCFFAEHGAAAPASAEPAAEPRATPEAREARRLKRANGADRAIAEPKRARRAARRAKQDVVCEEQLLEAFAE